MGTCSDCIDTPSKGKFEPKEQPVAFIPNADYSTPAAIAAAPHNVTVVGRKDDSGKLDITLFFDDLPNAIEGVTEVLQWAVTNKQPVPYERGSWQAVDNLQTRYRAAQLRHMLNAAKAKISTGAPQHLARDHETGLLELAHVATDAMFQLEMAMREVKRLRAEAELETH